MPAVNPMRGEASFQMDGGSFTLAYTAEAFCQIEGVTGVSFFDTIAAIQSAEIAKRKPKLSDLRALLWAGFQQHHPEVTLAYASDLVLRGETAALEAMSAALAASMPKAEAAPANPRKRDRAGTGSN